jgi:D-alanine-D-alanine ligase
LIYCNYRQTYRKFPKFTKTHLFSSYFCSPKNADMLNIAIIAGGDSGEYDISMKSGKQVEIHLDRKKYRPFLVEIRGKEWTCHIKEKKISVDKNNFSIQVDGSVIRFDAVFNAIHGTPGEDGRLLGYFDLLKIPYTSCGVTTSALTFNKSFCKKVVASFGVKTAKSVHLFHDSYDPEDLIRKEIPFPCFVKPNNGGSSVGMSKVNRPEDLAAALEKAFREDPEILVEEYIRGRELTCGVIRTTNEVMAFPVTEIISKKDFFDYEAKYKDNLAEEVCPAKIPQPVAGECRKISIDTYKRLNCAGVVRFDYIWTGDALFFLEVNTVPGLSEQSIVPKMAIANGWTMTELFSRMIDECIKLPLNG